MDNPLYNIVGFNLIAQSALNDLFSESVTYYNVTFTFYLKSINTGEYFISISHRRSYSHIDPITGVILTNPPTPVLFGEHVHIDNLPNNIKYYPKRELLVFSRDDAYPVNSDIYLNDFEERVLTKRAVH